MGVKAVVGVDGLKVQVTVEGDEQCGWREIPDCIFMYTVMDSDKVQITILATCFQQQENPLMNMSSDDWEQMVVSSDNFLPSFSIDAYKKPLLSPPCLAYQPSPNL